ncbi:MAG: PorV/PorQ family protein [Saprospiraceae bacterium]|nr:PorV/PorQ family protein [Saprospiraceae bacterium]
MKEMIKKLNKLAVFFFLMASLFYQNKVFAQKYSNAFLQIGVGAAGQGLAYACVASTDNTNAAYWNPAGIVRNNHTQWEISAMHSEWFGGIGKYDYLGVTLPGKNEKQRIALSLIRFGVDDIPNTLSLYNEDGTVNFDNLSSFSASDYAFLFSYSKKIGKNTGLNPLSMGLNAKIIHRNIGKFANSWGFGLDAGVQYHKNNVKAGIMFRDITSTFNVWRFSFSEEEKNILGVTGNDLPSERLEITNPQIVVGTSFLKRFNKIGISPELDFYIQTDGRRNTLLSTDKLSLDPAIGCEINFISKVFLRFGANQFQFFPVGNNQKTWAARPAFGAGFKTRSIQIDYGFNDPGIGNGAHSHIISTLLRFGGK